MRKRYLIGGLITVTLIVAAITTIAVARFAARRATAQVDHQREMLLAPPKQSGATLASLTRAVERHEGDARAWANLADWNLRHRDFQAAIDNYQKSLAIDPNVSATWSALGEAHIQTGTSNSSAMPEGAKSAFRRALALDRNDLRARFYFTMEKDFSGYHDEAIGEWLAMLRVAPMGSDADNAIRAAIAASVKRNLTTIKAEMEKAMQVQPKLLEGPQPRS
jgi:cytochrome c-type biogenesis protein CcmH